MTAMRGQSMSPLTVIFFVAVTLIHYLLKGMNSFVRFLISPKAADRS